VSSRRKTTFRGRHFSFILLLGIYALSSWLLRTIGLSSAVAFSLATLLIVGIFFWNRRSRFDRFHGMAAPVTSVTVVLALIAISEAGTGTFFEALRIVALVGPLGAIGHFFWHYASLGGPSKNG